ncbi:MAG: leucine-rich repeat protein [Ruminococcus sp.]|nr:leucine-rich repeat protein [Ruminococcus sp.]
MKKKSFLAVLCSASLLLQLAPAVLAEDVVTDTPTDSAVTTDETTADASGTFGYATWTLVGDTLTLSGNGDLPDSVDDNYVNVIGNSELWEDAVHYPWMKYRSIVKHLVIEDGIQNIPQAAFAYFYALETVDFPSTPLTINSCAFYAKEFDIRDGLVAKKTYDIPDNVTLDGSCIFTSDDGDSNSYRRIKINANRYSPTYYYCLNHPCYIFTETGIAPEAITSGTCGKNATWNFDFDTKTLYIEGNGATESISDDATLKGIEWIQPSIEKVVYGEGITEIAPFTAQKINTHIVYNEPMQDVPELVLPSTLTTIDDYAFNLYLKVKDVQIPYGVTTIGNNAFSDCHKIENVVLPGTVKKIGNCAFFVCDSLKSITIPTSVTEIGTSLARSYSGVSIFGYTGSTAESYAKENNYAFYSLSASVGDVNEDGVVNLMDAIALNKYLAGMISLTDSQLVAANCNTADGTSNINEDDVTALMKFVINLIPDLPVSE